MMKSALSVLSLGLVLSTASGAAAQSAQSAAASEKAQNNKDQYIVVFKPGVAKPGVPGLEVADVVANVHSKFGGSVIRTFEHALHGAVMKLPAGAAAALAKDDRVAIVEEDKVIEQTRPAGDSLSVAPMSLTASAVSTAAASGITNISQPTDAWALDRLDQRNLPVDGVFNYPNQAGEGVHIYHISSGASMNHEEFINDDGTTRILPVWDWVDNDSNPEDCSNYTWRWGSLEAGLVAGKKYGVAKKATVHVLRAVNCAYMVYSNTIAALDWVTANHVHPAVVYVENQGDKSEAMNAALAAAIAHGVTAVAMAGNNNLDACAISPASLPENITVGSTRNTDKKLEVTNWGSCVDIFAPGLSLYGSWAGPNVYEGRSGTNLSAALVAGVAALYLGQHPDASPAEVTNALISQATTGLIPDLPANSGTPNRLVYEGFLTPLPTPSPCSGLCSNPAPIAWTGSYQGGNLGSGALCYETSQTVNGGNCGNFVGTRTLKVNGVSQRCDYGNWASIPAKRNGGYCIQISAGEYPWAYMTLW